MGENGKIRAADFRLRQWKLLGVVGRVGRSQDIQDATNKEQSEDCSCVEKQTEHMSVKMALSEVHRGEEGRGIVGN